MSGQKPNPVVETTTTQSNNDIINDTTNVPIASPAVADQALENQMIKEDTPITTSTTTEVPTQENDITRTNNSMAEIVGGSQVRRYLNENVTPYLIKGMKQIATEQPDDPLRRLGEYLIEQSEQLKK